MKLTKYAAVLATTTAIVGAGFAVPTANAFVGVADDALNYSPTYQATTVLPGETATVELGGEVPAGTTFSMQQYGNQGWTYSVDPATGTVTITADASMTPGSRVSLPVTAKYPDGSYNNAQVTVEVAGYPEGTGAGDQGQPLADATDLSYDAIELNAGGTTTLNPTGTVPEGTRFFGPNGRDGWNVAVDQYTGAVTVTAPEGALKGSGLNMGITAAFRDGSQKKFTVSATVTQGAARDVDTYAPSYAATTTTQGQSVVVKPTGEVPAGTKYSLGATPPAGWNIQVNETTGDVTVTPPAHYAGGYVQQPIRVTYPDGSYEFAQVHVTIQAQATQDPQNQQFNVTYAGAQIRGDQSATLAPRGEFPEGTKFALQQQMANWDITVDENTGIVTATPQKPAGAGAYVSFPVRITYPDGTIDYANARVDVTENAPRLADSVDVSYSSTITVEKSGSVTFGLNGTVPEGTRFSLGNDIPAGWNVQVNESTGEVTATPPANAGAGAWISFPIKMTFSDGSIKYETFRVTVEGPTPGGSDTEGPALAETTTVNYRDTDMELDAGQTVAAQLDGALPAGTKVFGPNGSRNGWTIATDESTGRVTVSAPANANPGAHLSATVVLQFSDGSSQTKTLTFTVAGDDTTGTEGPGADGWDADNFAPTYPAGTLPAGGSGSVEVGGDFPEGTTFELASGMPSGWTFAVDKTTGRVTASTNSTKNPGAWAEVPVRVNYPDGSYEFVKTRFTVEGTQTPETPEDPQAETTEVNYTTTNVELTAGESTTITIVGGLPEGAKVFGPNSTRDGWTIATNETTGAITVTPPADANAGASLTTSVIIQFADGSTQTKQLKFTVEGDTSTGGDDVEGPTQAESSELTYSNATLKPGQTITAALIGTLPSGARVVGPNETRGGWTVSTNQSTGEMQVTAPADAANGAALTTSVSIVFADGSVQTEQVRFTVEAETTPPLVDTTTITYQEHTSEAGTTVVIRPTGEIPAGTKFTLAAQVPAGWNIQVNESTGAVTIEAPASANAGARLTIPVRISYPDGSYEFAQVQYTQTAVPEPETPQDPIADTADLNWSVPTLTPGQTSVVRVNGTVPAGTTFTTGTAPAGWSIQINETTGEARITPPAHSAGSTVRFNIRATFADGSVKLIPVNTTVARIAGTVTTPTYQDLIFTGNTGSTTVDGHVEGATYTLGSQQPNGWNIQVDRTTGEVTATVDDDNVSRWVRVPIRVSYADGSYEFTYLRLERKADAQDIDLDEFIQGDGGSSLSGTNISVEGSSGSDSSSGSSVEGATSVLPVLGVITLIGGSLAALWPILNRALDGGFIYFR